MNALPTPAGPDAGADPLVPAGDAPLGEWGQRLSETWQRSWRVLAGIFLLTFAAPQVASVVISDAFSGAAPLGGVWPVPTADGATGLTSLDVAGVGLVLFLAVAALLVTAVGWGAGIWAVTQAAVGMPVTVATALQAGLRRVAPMSGWYLLYTLLMVLGFLACILPGIYVALAGCLFSFAVIFERGRSAALFRSFALVHKAFWIASGRVALLFLIAVVSGVAAFAINYGLGFLPTEDHPGNPVGTAVVDSLIALPAGMAMLIGLLLTYTQLRAREGALSTHDLWTAANRQV